MLFRLRKLRHLLVLALSASCLAQITVFSADAPGAKHTLPRKLSSPAILLPNSFAGWQQTNSTVGADPAAADAANAALLKEYGFAGWQKATYTRADNSLSITAAAFNDGAGAFGAFTYYIQPPMEQVQVGDRAFTLARQVIFLRGNVVVEARFQQVTSMSAAELRELAQEMNVNHGNGAAPPELLADLPAKGMDPNSLRYAMGPISLAAIGSPLPPAIVDFSRSGELITAQYRLHSGGARLTVVAYPTPQIALDREGALAALFPSAQRTPAALEGLVSAQNADGGVLFRRSGPLLVYVTGAASASDLRSLAESVNYEATVSWSQSPPITANAVVRLVVYSLVLALLLIAIFLASAIFFGGSYAVLTRFFPKLKLPAQDKELIKLNLRD